MVETPAIKITILFWNFLLCAF